MHYNIPKHPFIYLLNSSLWFPIFNTCFVHFVFILDKYSREKRRKLAKHGKYVHAGITYNCETNYQVLSQVQAQWALCQSAGCLMIQSYSIKHG